MQGQPGALDSSAAVSENLKALGLLMGSLSAVIISTLLWNERSTKIESAGPPYSSQGDYRYQRPQRASLYNLCN